MLLLPSNPHKSISNIYNPCATRTLQGPTFLQFRNRNWESKANPFDVTSRSIVWGDPRRFTEAQLFDAAAIYYGRQGKLTPAAADFVQKAIPWMAGNAEIKHAVYRVIAHSHRDAVNPKNADAHTKIMARLTSVASLAIEDAPFRLNALVRALQLLELPAHMYRAVNLTPPVDDGSDLPGDVGAQDDGPKFITRTQKFHVYLTVGGNQTEVGSFKDEGDAKACFAKAIVDADGYHAEQVIAVDESHLSQAHAAPAMFTEEFQEVLEGLAAGKRFTATELHLVVLLIVATFVDTAVEKFMSQLKVGSGGGTPNFVHPDVATFARLKERVEPLGGATSKLLGLSRFSFTSDVGEEHLGLLDQMSGSSANRITGWSIVTHCSVARALYIARRFSPNAKGLSVKAWP